MRVERRHTRGADEAAHLAGGGADVAGVTDPFAAEAAALSADGRTAYLDVTYDLDNDSQRHNEMDYDLTLRFGSDPEGKKGEVLEYSKYHNPHDMKAPQWVLDAKLFRFDNWRKIDEFIYVCACDSCQHVHSPPPDRTSASIPGSRSSASSR